MTEIERIREKRDFFTEEFFEEEDICGFHVSKERKKIWAISMDILLEFDRICKKHELAYFLMYGSLLGAIRHGGFVPWDDDIDVAMPRKDYDMLRTLGFEFEEPYFLQTPYTDGGGYYYSITKIRNSNTTAVSKKYRWEKFNQGMSLDIFPLDNCMACEAEQWHEKINALNLDNSNFMRKSIPRELRTYDDEKRILSHSGRNPLDVFEEIEGIAKKYKDVETEYISVVVFTRYNCKNQLFRAEDFKKTQMCSFKQNSLRVQLPIPNGYDRILHTLYGDYLRFPPAEQRGNWHSNKIFDMDMPYTEYLLDEKYY